MRGAFRASAGMENGGEDVLDAETMKPYGKCNKNRKTKYKNTCLKTLTLSVITGSGGRLSPYEIMPFVLAP